MRRTVTGLVLVGVVAAVGAIIAGPGQPAVQAQATPQRVVLFESFMRKE